eukprot:TRINITY_DN12017_c0_g4_i3.p1 TRINITY_DN12017_c0_g4~~TRINITY_DN12017_c0_g4_i3.p1  ORF type:complete len:305 (-),score=43.25 TRINITY_DN12017_c0_g4_i3:733-1647(-)
MGKGGTKFVGDAKGVRTSRKRRGYSFRDIKRNMAKFLAGEEHPEFQQAQKDNKSDIEVIPLPMWLLSRPHIYMEFSLDTQFIGRLVFELFDDYVSSVTQPFYSRCSARSPQSLKGSGVHRLLNGFAMYAGASNSGTWISAMNKDLKHVEAGTLSMSQNGDEFAIAFAKAHALDTSYQVIGMLRDGIEILQKLSQIKTSPDDQPVGRLYISDCGQLDGQTQLRKGMFGGVAYSQSSVQSSKEILDSQLEQNRSEIKDSINVGLQKRQKLNDNQIGTSQRKKKARQFEQILLQDDGEDVSEASEEQ